MRSGGEETDKAARNTVQVPERRRELKTPREDRELARQEYGINHAKSGRARTGARIHTCAAKAGTHKARQEYGINRAKTGRAKTGAIVRNGQGAGKSNRREKRTAYEPSFTF